MSAIVLTSKPGLQPNSAGLSIPTTWDPVWFKNLVSNLLKGADVRNAIAGPGITITGNIASPYATISAGGAGAPFTAPVIIKTTGGVTVFEVFNSLTGPTVEGFGPTAGGLVDMTPDVSNFTATLTGCTTSPTATCPWTRIGNLVTLFIGPVTGTSNANTCTLTGLPAAIQPTRTQWLAVAADAMESGGALSPSGATMQVQAGSGTITFFFGGSSTGWGATLIKGISTGFSVSYLLS
jgi:hypothetical protein